MALLCGSVENNSTLQFMFLEPFLTPSEMRLMKLSITLLSSTFACMSYFVENTTFADVCRFLSMLFKSRSSTYSKVCSSPNPFSENNSLHKSPSDFGMFLITFFTSFEKFFDIFEMSVGFVLSLFNDRITNVLSSSFILTDSKKKI